MNATIIRKLAKWFAANQRAMPWRETRDPYCVWLSEIMLQQTQVATVIPYYKRFLERFPTLADLANADLDDVLKLWSGLGYYSRARNLHRGAQTVVARFGGRVPDSPEMIREISGIGDYTAGAILSIAFARAEPLVDGNVARVLSRVLLLDGDWRGGEGKRAVWENARIFVALCAGAKIDPGQFNQALMELGATICSPRNPACLLCPIKSHCQAFKNGVQHDYPQLRQKEVSPTWWLRAWLVEDKSGNLLFAQRKPGGLFGGLWEAPMERMTNTRTHGSPKVFASLSHVLTHRVLKVRACHARKGNAIAPKLEQFQCWSGSYARFRWLPASAALAGEIAIPSLQVKILRAFVKHTHP